jgi:hypothetical protein
MYTLYNLKDASEGLKNHKCIYKFVKDKNGQLTGALLGCILDDKHFTVGWSLRDKKDPKPFNKEHALKVAFLRAANGTTAKLPCLIEEEIVQFRIRCSKYFKGCVFSYLERFEQGGRWWKTSVINEDKPLEE